MLCQVTSEVIDTDTFDINQLKEKVEQVISYPENILEYYLKSGEVIKKEWKTPSSKESWTPEMKEKAKHKYLEQLLKVDK